MIRDFDPNRDLEECVAMAVALLGESRGHAPYIIDERKIAAAMRSFELRGWVNEQGGRLTGYLFAACVAPFYSQDLTCNVVSLYVRPENRNGFVAFKLVKRMEAWGRSLGAVAFSNPVTTGLRGATSLMPGMGYACMGGVWVKGASHKP